MGEDGNGTLYRLEVHYNNQYRTAGTNTHRYLTWPANTLIIHTNRCFDAKHHISHTRSFGLDVSERESSCLPACKSDVLYCKASTGVHIGTPDSCCEL